MRPNIRWKYLARLPELVWDILARGRYDFTFDLMPMHSVNMSLRKRLNLFSAGLNLGYRRARPWSWPIHLEVELSSVCNLRCPLCPSGKNILQRDKRMMDMDLYSRLMDEIGPYLLCVFLWAWGEPLLYPKLSKAIRIATDHGVIPIVSTNGQNLAEERILAELIQEPPVYLIVAIDGLTDETNSAYRIGARLERTLDGVHRLLDIKRERKQKLPILHMRYLAMKHNQHELKNVESFARDHGFDMLSIRGLSILDSNDEVAYQKLMPDLDTFQAYDYDADQRVKRDDFICQMAFCFPVVLADGSVVACDEDYNAEHSYGRFDDAVSFADIWFGPQATVVRRTIRDSYRSFAFCQRCPYMDREANTCSISIVDL